MATFDNFSEHVRLCALRIAESGAPALAGLYDLTSQRLVRYATTITSNQHDAEDAVSAALVRVSGDPNLLYRSARPWPYLLHMVRNESLVILRRRKRWSLISDLSDLLTRRSVDQIEVEEQHRAVWVALRSLPTEQSEVVVLKIWEAMTFSQIAEILEISPSTVASRYRYGLEKLAAILHTTNAEVIYE
ncbi:ECF RNA polymerase sigma factor SigL [Novipirellula aureliae]|uniref:ECF RNA polymerase sigma factor SigL n=1 Tax=Novipirellula aureliae TaxID=2527966 RepID=A0A5C6DNQ0_9BACT|nr:sigma-70 family RNA polymerase sigma factor [Novipirellula aureliae]TWU38913.1 ECF RNA polymerase sigma factor SigL [Novipirellula aureliae]